MNEEDYLPLSYLSQLYYCPRRAGLLLVDQQWEDNALTAEGTLIHDRVHSKVIDSRGASVILRTVPVRSHELRLVGMADCVEIEPSAEGVNVPGFYGLWLLTPVEFKHGVRRDELEYQIQLCAQAMCLEEMLGCAIPQGYLFFEEDHRRVAVALDERPRLMVKAGARELHEMLARGRVPSPHKSARCRGCSMVEVCLPRARRGGQDYLEQMLSDARSEVP